MEQARGADAQDRRRSRVSLALAVPGTCRGQQERGVDFPLKRNKTINSSFISKDLRAVIKGCRIQFSLHSVRPKLSSSLLEP